MMVNRLPEDEQPQTEYTDDNEIKVDEKLRKELQVYRDGEQEAQLVIDSASKKFRYMRNALWQHLYIYYPQSQIGHWEFNWQTFTLIKKG